QGVRHKWRRILERQQRTSVRKPDALLKFLRAGPDSRDPVWFDVHPGQNDRVAAPWLGRVGRDGIPIPGRGVHDVLGGGRAIRSWPVPTNVSARCKRAEIWR